MGSRLVSGPRTAQWSELTAHAARLASEPVRDLFARDPRRFEQFSREAAGLLMDFSRQRLDSSALGTLLALADGVGLRARIDAMWRGEIINPTEGRAVLHVALRQPPGAAVGGADIERLVLAERARMLAFADGVRSGAIRGSGGQRFTRVVNIGIGGSDLGPAMAVQALRAFGAGAPRCEFVSNVDGCHLAEVLESADPRTTLFIVASKTFTTLETRTNALSARAWLEKQLGRAAVPAHFAAVSVNTKAMDEFGVHPEYRFQMWDWVGGRYSIWSSIGVTLAIAIGSGNFLEFLGGGHAMDEHFRSAPWADNLPALMGLIGVWNINFMKLPTLAVLPYDDSLRALPRLPAAARDGEQRQVGDARWNTGRVRDGGRHLGRARQQCATFVLSAAAPGHATRRARLPAAGALLLRQPAATEPRDRKLPRPGGGLHGGTECGRGARGARAAGPASARRSTRSYPTRSIRVAARAPSCYSSGSTRRRSAG